MFGPREVPRGDFCESCKTRDKKAREKHKVLDFMKTQEEKNQELEDKIRHLGIVVYELEKRLEREKRRELPMMTSCQKRLNLDLPDILNDTF